MSAAYRVVHSLTASDAAMMRFKNSSPIWLKPGGDQKLWSEPEDFQIPVRGSHDSARPRLPAGLSGSF